MTEPHGWLIDTVPSERFPVYTRLNANDVLPRSDRIVDLVTQIVAATDAVPTVSGPGALRLVHVREGDR